MTYGFDTFVCFPWREIMNHLALLSMFADSLHMWVPIPVFNSLSLKMSLMHFVRDTIDMHIFNMTGSIAVEEICVKG